MIAHAIFDGLDGTSSDKLGELLARVRAEPKLSFGIGLAERLPGTYGEVVRWIVNDLPTCEPAELDDALERVAALVLSLRSDSIQLAEGA